MPKKSSRANELDAEADRLYGLPLAEFTPEKTALAARLRKAGRKAEADEVARLPKPSRSAWAVNMLFRREAARMAALLAAGERARAAQRSVVRGAASGGDLRGAIEEANDMVAELHRRAVQILSEDGTPPGGAIVERVATDLQALAFDPQAPAEAAGGRLVADLDPPGFEVLAGLQVASGGKRPALVHKAPAARDKPRGLTPARKAGGGDAAARPGDETERARREREEAKERARAEREAEAERRQRAERAAAEVRAAESEAAVRRRAAERAEKAAAEAESRAEEARRRAEAAEKAAAEARREAERTRERAEAGDAAVERARAELAEARGTTAGGPRLRLVER